MKNINCPHFDLCSGCHFNTNVTDIPVLLEAIEFFSKKGIQLPPLQAGNPIGWRTRAKLAVRGNSAKPLLGLFEEGSHNIVDIPRCKVHHPSINLVVEKIKKWIQQEDISIYQEKENLGLLRYIQCSVERKTGKVQVVFVLNGTFDDIDESLLRLYNSEKNHIHSLWVNENTGKDNVIFGSFWKHIVGEDVLWESICGTDVCFHPACFCQANLEMYEKLINKVIDLVPKDGTVLEMYAGVGAIGLCVVKKVKKVWCVEITPEALHCFELSKKRLPTENKEKIFLEVCNAENPTTLLKTLQSNVMIVDPPRKGLDRNFIPLISGSSVKKLVYISCGWASFRRDCELLTSKGWQISFVEAFLFFPGTNHIELLCIFTRI